MCRVSRHATRSFKAHKLSPNLSPVDDYYGLKWCGYSRNALACRRRSRGVGLCPQFYYSAAGGSSISVAGCDAGWLRSAWLHCRLAALSLVTGRLNGQHSPFSTAYG